METKVETLEGNNAQVTVVVDAADVDRRIKKAYKDFAQKYNFPGFRKGKAPRKVIDSVMGPEAALSLVTDEILNYTWPLAIEAEKLSPVGNPEIDDSGLVVAGQPYEYSFTIALRPEIELDSYDGIAIELPFAEATEAEIDDQITAMADHYTELEDASAATKMKPENFAELTIKATDAEGNEVESASAESMVFSLENGLYNADFDAEILGMKKGQTKEFTLEIPADETGVLLAEQAGNKLNFEVTCEVVKKKVTPEINDEWAKEKMGFESLVDLRERVAESLTAQKGAMIPRLKENAIMTKLIERVNAEVPQSMVEEAETSLLQDFFTQLQQAGMTFDAYLQSQGLTTDQFKADLKAQAADHVKEELALEAWARHFGMDVTDEELSAEFAKVDVDDPAGLEQEWREAGRLHLIRTGMLRSKAINDLLDKAEVTEVDFIAEEKKAKKPSKKKAEKKEATEEAAE